MKCGSWTEVLPVNFRKIRMGLRKTNTGDASNVSPVFVSS
jgi:hypothetical protein